MTPPQRRVTTALVAVLEALCDNSPIGTAPLISSPRTVGEIAIRASRSTKTTDGVIARLTADQRLTTGTVDRKTRIGSAARALTTYRLNDDGIAYARGVLTGHTDTMGE